MMLLSRGRPAALYGYLFLLGLVLLLLLHSIQVYDIMDSSSSTIRWMTPPPPSYSSLKTDTKPSRICPTSSLLSNASLANGNILKKLARRWPYSKGAAVYLGATSGPSPLDSWMCVSIIVLALPPKPLEDSSSTNSTAKEFKGIPGFPKDSIYLQASGEDYSVQSHIEREPYFESTEILRSHHVRIYSAWFEFTDPDMYTLDGYLECKSSLIAISFEK